MARLQFSNTTDRTGIIQLIERATNTQSATTGSYPLKVKTVDVNEALGEFARIAIKASGRHLFDDTNQEDFPILQSNLVSGEDNVTLLYDGADVPNQILDILSIRVKDPSGNFKTLKMIDRTDFDISKYDGVVGVPQEYDLLSDGILMYPTPNYSVALGVEAYVSRNPVYFLSTDTNKVAGIPETLQAYLHLRPSYFYCLYKGLPQATALGKEVEKLEKAIEDHFSTRVKTEKPGLRVRQESTR